MAASGTNPSGGSSTSNTGSIASSTAQFDRSRANRSGLEDSAKYLLSLPVSTHYLEKNALVCCRTDRFNNLCRNLGTNNCILSDGLLHKSAYLIEQLTCTYNYTFTRKCEIDLMCDCVLCTVINKTITFYNHKSMYSTWRRGWRITIALYELNADQLVVTIRLACGDQFCKACFMDTYFTDDPPTCRARDRHAAEHRLPSAEVLGIGADQPQAQTTAAQGKSKLSSAKPSVSSKAYRIQVGPTGAAATTAMCEVLELVIGVWKGNGDETLDYVCPFMSLFLLRPYIPTVMKYLLI